MSYEKDHVCNYASRYRPTMCRNMVRDGERYCKKHRVMISTGVFPK